MKTISKTISICSCGELERLTRLVDSLIERTTNPEDITVSLVDNGNWSNFHNLIQRLKDARFAHVEWFTHLDRQGLAITWDKAIVHDTTSEWIILLNDDCVVEPGWDQSFNDLLVEEHNYGMYLLCDPNNWSGFAISKTFYDQHGPFNLNMTEGYWEDNDFYLKVAYERGLRTKHQIYTQAIFCLPYVRPGQRLFTHKPNRLKAPRRWNEQVNKAVFDKNWTPSNSEDHDAIELKNGEWYRPRK